jgi:hypothetical protein
VAGGNLFNVTTADAYTDAATLQGPPSARVRVAVYNAAVAYQLQIDSGRWEPEDFLGPWVGTFTQPWVTGIRFRSLAAGHPAQVSAKLLPEGVDEGAPPGFGVDPSGAITPGSGMTVARVFSSVPLSIPTGTATVIPFDSKNFDTGGYFDVAGHPTRLASAIGGFFLVGANVEWAANAVGVREVSIRQGGVNLVADAGEPAVTGGLATSQEVVHLLSLAAGDYFEVVVVQNSGGPLNILATNFSPVFCIARLA